MVLIVLDRKNSLLLVANKLHVVIHLNCVCNTAELMLESISLVRVITIWNQLPDEVFNAVTVAAFVAKLRSCYLTCYLL